MKKTLIPALASSVLLALSSQAFAANGLHKNSNLDTVSFNMGNIEVTVDEELTRDSSDKKKQCQKKFEEAKQACRDQYKVGVPNWYDQLKICIAQAKKNLTKCKLQANNNLEPMDLD